jgi:hypothetical protein
MKDVEIQYRYFIDEIDVWGGDSHSFPQEFSKISPKTSIQKKHRK